MCVRFYAQARKASKTEKEAQIWKENASARLTDCPSQDQAVGGDGEEQTVNIFFETIKKDIKNTHFRHIDEEFKNVHHI